MIIRTKNEAETIKKASSVAKKIVRGGTLCLYGDLGSGKTIFAKGVAEVLGIDHFTVKSPTYTYIRKYKKKDGHFFHIDLYRIDEPDELLIREIEEIRDKPSNIIVIEWADKIKDHLPKDRIDIFFEYIDKNSRKITIKNGNFGNKKIV